MGLAMAVWLLCEPGRYDRYGRMVPGSLLLGCGTDVRLSICIDMFAPGGLATSSYELAGVIAHGGCILTCVHNAYAVHVGLWHVLSCTT